MPDRDAIERGYEFEDYVAQVLDLKKTPGSGNKFFAKGDAVGHGLCVSCKSETNPSWNKIYKNLMEAIGMAEGTGNIPVLIHDIPNEIQNNDDIVIMRLSDFVKALIEVKVPETFQSKGIEKRSNAEVPIMLR